MHTNIKRRAAFVIILLLFLLVIIGTAGAERSGSFGEGKITWTLDDNGVLTVSGSGEMDAEYDGEEYWNNCREEIKKAVVCEGITGIGGYMFSACTNLTEVTLPNSLKSLYYCAFSNCGKLTGISLPDGLESLDASAFRGCTGMKDIMLPDGITRFSKDWEYDGLNWYASLDSQTARVMGKEHVPFLVPGVDCWLEYVYDFETGEEIGLTALRCAEDATDVRIPEGVIIISSLAFYERQELVSVTIPSSIRIISEQAFADCRNLREVTFAGKMNGCRIEELAFAWLSSLEKINFQEGILSIGEEAFDSCAAKELTLPEGLLSIARNAFETCYDLTDLYLPDSLQEIGREAIPASTILHVGEGTYAQQFAEKNGYTYVIRGQEREQSYTATTVEEKVREIIENEITPDMSEYRKAVVLHNWLLRNVEYELTGEWDCFTAKGALLDGKAVCNGYTVAYALLLEAVGIESVQAYGDDHTWNMVKLNGTWCHIDVTWDDSGSDMFNYFGVDDFALRSIGSHENYDPPHVCDDYRMSMAYRSGRLDEIIRNWTAEMTEAFHKGETDHVIAFEQTVSNRMAIEMLRERGMTIDGKTYDFRIVSQKGEANVIDSYLLSLKTGGEEERVAGDVNGDIDVDGRDVVRLMKYLAGETDPETGVLFAINEANADLNGDGTVNELDLIRLVKMLADG